MFGIAFPFIEIPCKKIKEVRHGLSGILKDKFTNTGSHIFFMFRATELIYDAYNAVTVAYSFSGRLKEAFCHVAAYSGYVNVGFNRGADLADPDGILVGAGARIRHVRVTRPSDLGSAPLQRLIRAAVAQGRALVPAQPDAPTSRVRPTTGSKRRPRARIP